MLVPMAVSAFSVALHDEIDQLRVAAAGTAHVALAGDGGAGAVVGVDELLQQRRQRRDRLIRRAVGEGAMEAAAATPKAAASFASAACDASATAARRATMSSSLCSLARRAATRDSINWRASSRSPKVAPSSWSVTASAWLKGARSGAVTTGPPPRPRRIVIKPCDSSTRNASRQCGAGDPVRRRELLLRWEPLADLQLTAHDLAAEPFGDDLVRFLDANLSAVERRHVRSPRPPGAR